MTKTFILLTLLLTTNICFGQKTFRTITKVNPTSTFVSEFIIASDSTCFYNQRYKDNSQFYLYRGKIVKLNDTLYSFNYRPILEFGCNKRSNWETDSVYISVVAKDTVLSSLIFDVKTSKHQTKVDRSKREFDIIKNAGRENFMLDTKFFNPLARNKIVMTISPMSEPNLLFYGHNTKVETVTISIKKQILTVHHGEGKIWQDDRLTLTK